MVEWLATQGITGEVKAHVDENDVLGKTVVGVLPLHLASLAREVITIDMPLLKPEQRGKDMTPDEMNEAGAVLRCYIVENLW